MSRKKISHQSAPDLEEGTLGAILLDGRAIFEVIDILNPECYWTPANRIIYEVVVELYRASEPIDLLTVTHRLRAIGKLAEVGGPLYISQLTNRVASTANLVTHARILYQKFMSRELIRISDEASLMCARDEDPFEVLKGLELSLQSIYPKSEGNAIPVKDVIPEINEDIENRMNGVIDTVPTGFHSINKVLYGWGKSDMIVIAARPGMGKTAFIISTARRIGQMGFASLIFSLEMSTKQLTARIISQESEVRYEAITKRKIYDDELTRYHKSLGKVEGLPIYIDDTPALSVFEFRNRVRRMVPKLGIKLIIVDYLQLMTSGVKSTGFTNREQEVSTISRTLKQVAKEVNLPVIALSQLSRDAEREKKNMGRPMLSHLRESGAIEQDADIAAFIHRPEIFGFETYEDGTPTSGTAEFVIAKNRHGSLGVPMLKFVPEFARFEDYTPEQITIDHPHPDSFIAPKDSPF